MSARTDRMVGDYNHSKTKIDRELRRLDDEYRSVLQVLDNDELRDLGENCAEGTGSGHCWYCEAWWLYIERVSSEAGA